VIERTRLQTAVGRAERSVERAPSHLREAIQHRLDAAHHALERAAALWSELQERRRKDWKEYRRNLGLAREHRRKASRMLARVPEQA
jgi:hypothetical protein